MVFIVFAAFASVSPSVDDGLCVLLPFDLNRVYSISKEQLTIC